MRNKIFKIIDFISKNKLLTFVFLLMFILTLILIFNTNYEVVENNVIKEPVSYVTATDYSVIRTDGMIILEIRNNDYKDIERLINTLGLNDIDNLVISYPGAVNPGDFGNNQINPEEESEYFPDNLGNVGN